MTAYDYVDIIECEMGRIWKEVVLLLFKEVH